MMMFLLDDFSDHLPAPGFAPLPAKAATRQRTRLLPGSCGLLQPLPSKPGEPLPCIDLTAQASDHCALTAITPACIFFSVDQRW